MLKVSLIVIAFLMLLPATKQQLIQDNFDFFKDMLMAVASPNSDTKIPISCPEPKGFENIFDWFDFPKRPIQFKFYGANAISFLNVTNAETLVDLPDFNVNHTTVVLIAGWLSGQGYLKSVLKITEAYKIRRDINVLEVDTAGYVDTLYGRSANNTILIGENVATGLVRLSSVYDISKVHIIGFSLGAQVASAAGRAFTKESNGVLLQRITGLDPASPCFYKPNMPGLSKTDAQFVDVIHTNPGVLGTDKPVAHVDFFVGGLKTIQTNCRDIFCSHSRAVEYYAETVLPGNEYNLAANLCPISINEPNYECNGPIAFMGYKTSKSTQNGIYYLEVNNAQPYGKNISQTRIEERLQLTYV